MFLPSTFFLLKLSLMCAYTTWFPVPLHNRMISAWWNCLIIHWFIVSFFVSRMIEESGNKWKTMAEKRQLFIEMRESGILLEPLFACVGMAFSTPSLSHSFNQLEVLY